MPSVCVAVVVRKTSLGPLSMEATGKKNTISKEIITTQCDNYYAQRRADPGWRKGVKDCLQKERLELYLKG